MSLLRRPVALIAALAACMTLVSAAPALAQEADRVFRFADPEGGEIEAGVWLPEGAGDGLPRPLVVISHGNLGSFQGHHDTAEALADAGFVVAALTHPGDNWRDPSRSIQVSDRPRHVSLLIDYMTRDWTGPAAIDSARIGAFGFSAGAFTVTALAGGVSDPAPLLRHCLAHPDQFLCTLLERQPIDVATWRPNGHDPRVRAAVIAGAAFGMTFTADSLAEVRIPIQMWQAGDDEILVAPFHAEPIRDGLGRRPEFHRVDGALHHDFLPVCPPELAASLPQLCRSQPGFDRAAFHQSFNREVVRFFRETL